MKQSQKSGFTLIEVLIVMVIISVAIVGLMTTQTHSTLHDETLEEDILALQACENKIELLRDLANADFAAFFPDHKPGQALASFAVPGLSLQDNDPDGMCGKIEFPISITDPMKLGETNAETDWDISVLDMNGNSVVDVEVDEGSLIEPIIILQIRVSVQYKSVIGKDRERKLIATMYGPK
jgi:prepilin-type N-terminal cleavage/methylation domain-containing protein